MRKIWSRFQIQRLLCLSSRNLIMSLCLNYSIQQLAPYSALIIGESFYASIRKLEKQSLLLIHPCLCMRKGLIIKLKHVSHVCCNRYMIAALYKVQTMQGLFYKPIAFYITSGTGLYAGFFGRGGSITRNPFSRQLYALPEAVPKFWELLTWELSWIEDQRHSNTTSEA